MKSELTPIATKYKGYIFRSRLEARWAVFFDACGYSWEYEPQGFVLPDGRPYLPDFRLTHRHGWQTWVEVKANDQSDDGKMGEFAASHIRDRCNDYGPTYPDDCTLVSGDPYKWFIEAKRWAYMCPRCGCLECDHIDIQPPFNSSYWGCLWCDIDTPSGGGHPEEHGFFHNGMVLPHKGLIVADSEKLYENIKHACEKARSARFEHGETPL